MSQEIEAKLDVLKAMNSSLGKITNVQIRLTLAGEDALATEMDTRRKALLKQIETLQGQIADPDKVGVGPVSIGEDSDAETPGPIPHYEGSVARHTPGVGEELLSLPG